MAFAPPTTAPNRPDAAAPPRFPAAPHAAARTDRAWKATAGACLALAALSLLLPGSPTYDPMSWLIWGREIAHGTLHTTEGPSWKPLPVLFTTPFSLAGDAAAPELWLVVARAGALLGLAMVFRLARRLAGPAAGLVAAGALLVAEGYAYHAWRGNSEGLLVGLVLWAVERHLDGRRTSAFALGFGAALLRPEIWPLWALYGLHLAYRRPDRRVPVAAAFAAIPVAWFVPEHLGSGNLLRAASRALEPNLDSPAYAAFPAYEVLRSSLTMLPLVVGGGALVAVVAAARRRAGEHDHVVLVLAVAAAGLLAAVALMTQAGFSGNLRYVLLPVAFTCVLAGAGWVQLLRAARRMRGGSFVAVAIAAAGLAGAAHAARTVGPELARQARAAEWEAAGVADLPVVLARAGGREAFVACGGVWTTRFTVPAVAWRLRLRLQDVGIFPNPPGSTVAPRGSALARDPRFTPVTMTPRWSVRRRCRGA